VVDCVVAEFALDLAGRVRTGKSVRRLSIGVLPMMVLTLGISALAAWAGADNDVTPSRSRLFRQSTRRRKCDRKSTPMMDRVTSATTNLHVKSEVLAERHSSVGVDGSAISITEVVVRPLPVSRNDHARIHAEVGTRVDQELPFAVSVSNEEAARRCGADMCRR
jgi:hypothetical protein